MIVDVNTNSEKIIDFNELKAGDIAIMFDAFTGSHEALVVRTHGKERVPALQEIGGQSRSWFQVASTRRFKVLQHNDKIVVR